MTSRSRTRERGPGRWFAAGVVTLSAVAAVAVAQGPAIPPLAIKPPTAPPELKPATMPAPAGAVLPAAATVQPAPVPGTTQPMPMSIPGVGGPMPMPGPGGAGAAPPGGPAAPGALGQPRKLPFGDDKVRMPRLGNPPLGFTPKASPQVLEEFNQFIDGVIDPQHTLDLVVGRARLVMFKQPLLMYQLADPNLVLANTLSPTQLTMIGRTPGTTVLNLWFADPKNKDKEKILSYLVRVIPDPEELERLKKIYKALEAEINKAFPNSRIELTLVGDKLMVTGQAHDIVEAVQILRIVRANAPGGEQQRVPLNTVNLNVNAADLTAAPGGTPGLESFLSAGGPNVINNLRVPGEQQVMLRVTVAEVNRAAARSIGLNFNIVNNQGTLVFGQQTGPVGSLTGINLPFNLDAGGQYPILLSALRNLNYARSLAEPTLLAMNGQTATFLAGGQFPVPVVGGFGQLGGVGGGLQGVQFVPFGVQLAFSPLITDRDKIRLTVNATVSTRDNQAGTQIGGANVPGLSARTFSTTVEMREGQTMAVAGLIQNNLGGDSVRVPFLGDIPMLNRLLSVDRNSAGEQELVILITPELAHPLEQTERGPLPGSDIFEPGDLEFYLLGRMESRRSYDYRSPVRTNIHRMCAYRRCETTYILGPTGHVELAPQLPPLP